MTRPPFEVADVIRTAGSRFGEHNSLTWPQCKVLEAIARCRTAALGGHRDQCSNCGHQAISYNSCRNRHCPKCQTNARDQWLAKRQQELLPVGYYHLVFSVPHALAPLMWQNKRSSSRCYSKPVQTHSSKSQPIPGISALKPACSRSCTPGDRPCSLTRI